MEQTNWYAIYTAFRAEKRVKERLDQAGIVNYVPLRVVKRETGDRVERLEVPLFSGCIFVCVAPSDFTKVQSITGILSFMRESDKTPVTFSEQQVASLRLVCEYAEEIHIVENDTPIASTMRVVQGVLSGLEGEMMDDPLICQVLVRLPRVGNVVTIVPENSVVRL